MPSTGELLAALAVGPADDGRVTVPALRYYDGASAASGAVARMVFGGQLLAQAVMVASGFDAGQRVRSVNIQFVRAATIDDALTAEVTAVKSGGSISNLVVRFDQGARAVAVATVLCAVPGADAVTLDEPPSLPGGPEAHGAAPAPYRGYEIAIAGGAGVWDGSVGPPHTALWARFPGGPHPGAAGQALLSLATVPFLVDVALRPFEGLSAALAHTSLSTAVLAHGITFHRELDAGEWHLLDLTATSVAGGAGFGRGTVHAPDGRLVASFHQDMMIRGKEHIAGSESGRRL